MALHATLWIGGPLWWIASTIHDKRGALAAGGPWVHLAVIAFVAGCVVALQRSAMTDRPPRLRRWALVAGIALVVVFVLGLVFEIESVGDGPSSVWAIGIFGAMVSLPGLVVTGLVARSRARAAAVEQETAPEAAPGAASAAASGGAPGAFPGPPRPADRRPAAVLLAFAPLLVPVGVMLLYRFVDVAEPWSLRIMGPNWAGLLYVALLPLLWPAALVVAYGIDRLGARRTPAGWERGVAALAASTLVAAVFALPAVVDRVDVPGADRGTGWHRFSSRLTSGPAYSLDCCRPFTSSVRADGQGPHLVDGRVAVTRVEVPWFLRGAAAMELAAALASAWGLTRLGRGGRGFSALAVVLGGLLLVAGVAWSMPRHGPAAGPWTGVVAIAATLALSWWPTRHEAPPA